MIGGTLFGLVLSLKFIGWPLLLFWALKRRWRVVLAASLVILWSYDLAVSLLGVDAVVGYYRSVTGNVSALYQSHAFNFSPWTVGWRLFVGTGCSFLVALKAPPLVEAPALAAPSSVIVTASVLGAFLYAALRTRSEALAVMLVLLLSTLMSPIVWLHYFSWLLPPLALFVKSLISNGLPLRQTLAGAIIVSILALPGGTMMQLACWLSHDVSCVEPTVSFLVGLVTYVQPLAVLVLGVLLWFAGSDRRQADGPLAMRSLH